MKSASAPSERDDSLKHDKNRGINQPKVSEKWLFPKPESPFTKNGKSIWPFNLLSIVHPFWISDKIDENFENLFKLNIPFLDLRIGVQGVGESFTFIISKNTPMRPRYRGLTQEVESKFFNDMNWKVSPYISSSMTSIILSIFVSIIEHWEKEIKDAINNWLYVLLTILKNPNNSGISLSYVSTLMLKHEYNINSTAWDIILWFFFLVMEIKKE